MRPSERICRRLTKPGNLCIIDYIIRHFIALFDILIQRDYSGDALNIMKAEIEGMRPGEPTITDEQGRRIALILRLVPENPEEVAELKRFCRLTDAFTFVIDEEYRTNTAHIAPVYGEQTFSVMPRQRIDELD